MAKKMELPTLASELLTKAKPLLEEKGINSEPPIDAPEPFFEQADRHAYKETLGEQKKVVASVKRMKTNKFSLFVPKKGRRSVVKQVTITPKIRESAIYKLLVMMKDSGEWYTAAEWGTLYKEEYGVDIKQNVLQAHLSLFRNMECFQKKNIVIGPKTARKVYRIDRSMVTSNEVLYSMYLNSTRELRNTKSKPRHKTPAPSLPGLPAKEEGAIQQETITAAIHKAIQEALAETFTATVKIRVEIVGISFAKE